MSGRRRLKKFAIARRTIAFGFLVLVVLAARLEWEDVRGSLTALRWFSVVPISDPLAALEVSLASFDVKTPLVVGALVTIGLAVILGPVFCGWLCPVGFLLDLNQSLRSVARRRLLRRHVHLPAYGVPFDLRVFVLGFFLGLAVVVHVPAFQTVSPINLVVWSLAFGFTPAAIALVLIPVVEWFAPRLFCRSLCPLGGLYSLLGRVGRLKVRIDPRTAGRTPCHQCTLSCPMGIRVMEEYSLQSRTEVDDPRCTRCGTCVDACPGAVLRLGFRSAEADVAAPPVRTNPACPVADATHA